jgi:hypothetical protein|tara:strand:- start:357 stop:581 length:225 start_codon:yes stop_codon:yes gene_type:complete
VVVGVVTVKGYYIIAFLNTEFSEMGTDEACGACDKQFFQTILKLLFFDLQQDKIKKIIKLDFQNESQSFSCHFW